MTKFGKSIMTKSCLIAAIYATVRRSGTIRSASAFTGAPLLSTARATKTNFAVPISFTHLSMSTDVENNTPQSTTTNTSPKILRRVKTVDAAPSEGDVSIKGWVRTVRKQKTLAFVEVNDGSSLSGIQCVLSFDEIDEASKGGKFNYYYTFLIPFMVCLLILLL